MNQLEEIKARVEKASLGPWGAVKGSEYDGVDTLSGELTWDDHNGEVFKPEDANFIAHARTDIPKLIAALEAVEALHVANNDDYSLPLCRECLHSHPCPTLTATKEALQ